MSMLSPLWPRLGITTYVTDDNYVDFTSSKSYPFRHASQAGLSVCGLLQRESCKPTWYTSAAIEGSTLKPRSICTCVGSQWRLCPRSQCSRVESPCCRILKADNSPGILSRHLEMGPRAIPSSYQLPWYVYHLLATRHEVLTGLVSRRRLGLW